MSPLPAAAGTGARPVSSLLEGDLIGDVQDVDVSLPPGDVVSCTVYVLFAYVHSHTEKAVYGNGVKPYLTQSCSVSFCDIGRVIRCRKKTRVVEKN